MFTKPVKYFESTCSSHQVQAQCVIVHVHAVPVKGVARVVLGQDSNRTTGETPMTNSAPRVTLNPHKVLAFMRPEFPTRARPGSPNRQEFLNFRSNPDFLAGVISRE